MPLHIAGKKISWWWVAGVGGGAAAGILYLRHSGGLSSASSASSPSSVDPVTGLPSSEDNTVDSLTGMTYLAEAQEYGSVAAAEAAFAQGGGSAYSGTGALDSGFPTESYPTQAGGGTQSVQGYASNAQWSQAVTAGLTGLGYSSTDIAAALGLYFQGQPLAVLSDGASSLSIIQAATAEYGNPPVGAFQIIAPPSSGGANPPLPPPTGGGGNPPPAPPKPPAPPAAKVTVPNVVSEHGETARFQLENAGFKVTQSPPTTPAGKTTTVTAQSPRAGTKAAKGSTVKTTVKIDK